ncbi:hypothetical protein LRS05_11435 [Flavobacterium sp. J372]|uniref:putative phage abortive infection protein n=1 Tax=Flavobacterium sp. J372 TaxID=2898436 RepID=UPI002151B3CC|nr:putative phage abortive infection protein [Flavobacterium sp. J372]MCR5862716.1 hypothetical protein [Flavobacterium sp. J372]
MTTSTLIALSIFASVFFFLLLGVAVKYFYNKTNPEEIKESTTEESTKVKVNLTWKSIYLIIIAAFLICLSFVIPIILTRPRITKSFDFSQTGQIGDTIGGLMNPFIALAGVIVTGLAFYMQYKANQLQRTFFYKQLEEDKTNFNTELENNREQFEKQFQAQENQIKLQQFESSFFEMIRFHRENITELRYHTQTNTLENQQVIQLIFNEFIECYRDVKKFSNSKNPNDYIIPKHIKKLRKISSLNNINIDLIEWAVIDIAWSIVFYGLETEGESVIRKLFLRKYNRKYYYRLLYYLKLKPKNIKGKRYKRWLEIRKMKLKDLHPLIEELYLNRIHPQNINGLSQQALKMKVDSQYKKFYEGHQFRLGHYFRHLFQCYKFINSNTNLVDDKKYDYAKLLRAQLSTYEQALLFINSITSLGMKWEFTAEKSEILNKNLITRYHLIKNLPNDNLYGIEYKSFYKSIKFEFDDQINL